jgi:Factor for inversion stimulation Fis, transcriptional activator
MRKTDVLEDCVRASLERYFEDLGDAEPRDMWNMVMRCVERPVLEMAMERAAGNQSRASEMLGITRNTLRKKLLAHNIAPRS